MYKMIICISSALLDAPAPIYYTWRGGRRHHHRRHRQFKISWSDNKM